MQTAHVRGVVAAAEIAATGKRQRRRVRDTVADPREHPERRRGLGRGSDCRRPSTSAGASDRTATVSRAAPNRRAASSGAWPSTSSTRRDRPLRDDRRARTLAPRDRGGDVEVARKQDLRDVADRDEPGLVVAEHRVRARRARSASSGARQRKVAAHRPDLVRRGGEHLVDVEQHAERPGVNARWRSSSRPFSATSEIALTKRRSNDERGAPNRRCKPSRPRGSRSPRRCRRRGRGDRRRRTTAATDRRRTGARRRDPSGPASRSPACASISSHCTSIRSMRRSSASCSSCQPSSSSNWAGVRRRAPSTAASTACPAIRCSDDARKGRRPALGGAPRRGRRTGEP